MKYFFFSALIALFITPIVIKIYKKNNWLDYPEKQKHVKTTHNKAVPRGGGLAIFFTVLIAACLFLNIDKYLIGIIISALILTIVGFLDDIYNLHPGIRLFAGIVAALIVVGSGIGVAYVTNPIGLGIIELNNWQISLNILGQTKTIWVLADIFALFFIIWNMNIINWSKGVDGQLPGFASIALIFIGILSYNFIDDPTQFNTANLSFIVAGAYAGLLYWNWYPQKIMPGYGAGSLAGFFLSVLSILSGAKLATALMVMAVPTADGIFTITRRILAGKSPVWGDRGHLHHKLMDNYGWSKQQIALFYSGASLLLGILSLFLNTPGKIAAIAITCVSVFALLTVTKIRQHKKTK